MLLTFLPPFKRRSGSNWNLRNCLSISSWSIRWKGFPPKIRSMALIRISNPVPWCALACVAVFGLQASEHRGQVRFAGLPVPGVTMTASLGEQRFVAITDPQGVYTFPDLTDGIWKIQAEMLCFAP